MLRKLGVLLTIIGAICTGVLIYDWWTDKPISTTLLFGVLMLLLGMALSRRPREPLEGDSAGSLTPLSKKNRKEHKSWVSRQ